MKRFYAIRVGASFRSGVFALCTVLMWMSSNPAWSRDFRQSVTDSTKSVRPTSALSDTLADPRCVPIPGFYALQQTGNLDAHYDEFGAFGRGRASEYGLVDDWPEAWFQTPSEYDIEYLYAGTFWIGGRVGSDTLVSIGLDGWTSQSRELFPPRIERKNIPNVRPFHSVADVSYWAETTDSLGEGESYSWSVFDGRAHQPFPISIVNRSHVWRTSRTKDIVVYDVILRNEGQQSIEDGYFGLFFDCDVGHVSNTGAFADDFAGSLRNEGIAYVIDNDGDPVGGQFVDNLSPTKIFSLKVLASSIELPDTSFHWWQSNSTPSLDFGPTRVDSLGSPIHCVLSTGGTGTPVNDKDKYCLLSSGEWDYDMVYMGREDELDSLWLSPTGDPYPIYSDARILYSIGPFHLEPDSALRILFSTFSADSVLVDPSNISRLAVHPDSFLAHLNFANVIDNAHVADSLATILLDPLAPPSGLRLKQPPDTNNCAPTVEWDPYVFPGVDGYSIYAWEIPDDSIPYPGVIPPWLEPPTINLYDETDYIDSYSLDGLECGANYLINVAPQMGSVTGDPSSKLTLDRTKRPEAPEIVNSIENKVFVEQGDLATLIWNSPDYGAEFFNIYRVASSNDSPPHYYPYYDQGCDSGRVPFDSFNVDGTNYYYYSMIPDTTIEGDDTVYVDAVSDPDLWYLLSAVDSNGVESRFAMARVSAVDPPNNKALVLIGPPSAFHNYAVVSAFYDSVMSIAGIDYELMNLGAVIPVSAEFLYPYSMVIVDDNLDDYTFMFFAEEATAYLTCALLKRKLVYFGGFSRYLSFNQSLPELRPVRNPIPRLNFNVDSVYTYGFAYCESNSSICSDDSLKFAAAIAQSPHFPHIVTDTARPVIRDLVHLLWESDSPPSVYSFRIGSDPGISIDTLYTFRGLNSDSAVQEGDVIGLRSNFANTSAWLFGFHLWYMNTYDAAALLRAIADSTSEFDYCCRGSAGNISGDHRETPDISDLIYLVGYMFRDYPPPRCFDEMHIISGSETVIDIVDLTYLAAYMFGGGEDPQPCLPWPPLLKIQQIGD